MTPDSLVTPAANALSPLNSAISDCAEALQTGQSSAAACRRLGDILQGLGRFQETIFWHTAALDETPNLAALYVSLGRLCIRQRRWEQATLYYQQAIQHDPASATAYRSLGHLHAYQGQLEQATECRYQALMLRPDWATPKNQLKLGNLFLSAKQMERAIECYERSLQLQPSFQTHYNLAVTLTAQERWEAAKLAYQNALEINPDHAESYYGLCKVAEGLNDMQTAIEYCQRAAELSPDSFAVHHTLGTLLLGQNRWEAAATAYYQALKINPDFGWSCHNLGYALLKQGQFEAAAVQLEQAVQLLGDSPWTSMHLGEALSLQGKWLEAISKFLTTVRIQDDLHELYQKLGYAARRLTASGMESAIEQYQQSLSSVSDQYDSEFYRQVAAKLTEQNQMDAAYFFFRIALHIEPSQADLYSEVEKVWAKREQLSQWIAELRRSIQAHPERSWLYSQLGNKLTEQGEIAEAIEMHRRGIPLNGWHHVVTKNYAFTRNWFTHNIPTLTEQLQRFVNMPIKALEIGSFEGMSACWFLDYILTHPTACLTCIDPYFPEYFDPNIAKTGSPEKIVKLVGLSQVLLPTLEAESYDFIYVDGCHWAKEVQQDAFLSWGLLKPTGLMIFDDYEWSDPDCPGQETRIGIDAFLATVQSEVEILHHGYQLVVRKSIPANAVSNAVSEVTAADITC